MGGRVLIVDDHPGFRASVRRLLEDEGYEVVGEAEDGRAAIEATASLRPEIVLLDVQLPDLDGFEVARRIAGGGISQSPSAPAVVLTSTRRGAEFAALAEEKDIPYQRTMLRSGGQDGAAAQQAASGARAVGIVVGTRYIHTVTEMIEKSDLDAARRILVAYLKSK